MTKVFISSTSKDLIKYREAAINACLEAGLHPMAMEHFEAEDAGATEASLAKLAECQVYVGIFAFRYGTIEKGYTKSVTEMEFDGAKERNLDRLCFIADSNHAGWTPANMDDNREQVNAFHKRVREEEKVIIKLFTSTDNLQKSIVQALFAWKERNPTLVDVQPAPIRVPGSASITARATLVAHPDDVPRRAAKFIGRAETKAEIHRFLDEGKRVLMQGLGGMGKTALSGEIAAERIKDGAKILWVDAGDAPADALLQALARPFGKEREVASADDAAGVVRGVLRESDVRLVVLDNVWNGAALYKAVEALPRNLPLLASARQRFALDEILPVDQLSLDEALKLLELHAGKLGDDADKLCKELGYLPFALEIAGKTLKTHTWTPRDLLTKMGNELHTMTVPMGFHEDGRENVAALLETSLKLLDEETRQVFMAFGALFAPSATSELLSIVLDGKNVDSALTTLATHGLAQRVPPDDENVEYYRIHDLAFDYTVSKATTEQRDNGLAACLAYTRLYKEASLDNFRKLRPELENFIAAAAYAFKRERWKDAEDFAWNLWYGSEWKFLFYRGFYNEAQMLVAQAVEAARQRGNRWDEGVHLGNLGSAYDALGQYEQAIEYQTQALEIARENGDKRNEGVWLGNLGNAYNGLGQYEQAIEYHTQALEIARAHGDRDEEGRHLGNLGNAYNILGQYEQAIEYYTQALEIARAHGDKSGEGINLGNLGSAYNILGQHEQAIEYHTQALTIRRSIGDRYAEGNALNNLGVAYEDKGDLARALDYYQQSRTIRAALGLAHLVERVDGHIARVKAMMSGEQDSDSAQ